MILLDMFLTLFVGFIVSIVWYAGYRFGRAVERSRR